MIPACLADLIHNDLAVTLYKFDSSPADSRVNQGARGSDSNFASMFTSQEEFNFNEEIEVPTLTNRIKVQTVRSMRPAHTPKVRYNLRS